MVRVEKDMTVGLGIHVLSLVPFVLWVRILLTG